MNIILFWSSQVQADESYEQWLEKTIDLSYLHELALNSHIKLYKNIFLLTYQRFSDKIVIPNEIKVLNADEFFPSKDAHESMRKGHSVAHISDLVRFRLANEKEGVVLDMDAVSINPLPNIEAFCSTSITKRTGVMQIKFGPKHPFFKTDGTWDGRALSVFPFKVHSSIKNDINDLCTKIQQSLSESPKKSSKGWNYIMWEMKNIANSNDNVQVMKPIQCCPIPAWKAAGNCYSLDAPTKFDGKTHLFGNLLPSIDQIFEQSYFIQHFFESSYKSAKIKTDFWERIKKGSLLEKEVEFVLGKNWRKVKKEHNLSKFIK
jgi:hypothetical protein